MLPSAPESTRKFPKVLYRIWWNCGDCLWPEGVVALTPWPARIFRTCEVWCTWMPWSQNECGNGTSRRRGWFDFVWIGIWILVWNSLRGRFIIIDAYIELSSVIWQASNHISTRVCQVGMFPDRKAGCSKDTFVEAVGNWYSTLRLIAVTIRLSKEYQEALKFEASTTSRRSH